MRLHSRNSRQSPQSVHDHPTGHSSSPSTPGFPQGDVSERPSSSVDRPMSKSDSDSYPSWLPRRPPPPAPASTFHSSVGVPEVLQVEPHFIGGRKPTPRSVRIVSVPQPQVPSSEKGRREPTDDTKVENETRAWSKASGAIISPALLSSGQHSSSRSLQPRFRARGLHIDLLRNPSVLVQIWYIVYPIIVFAHVPLQTFLDFNTVFVLFQVSKYPNPQAPGVPGSGRNWALGTAAYMACWFAWIALVFVLYEIVYNFFRRWRVKRPKIMPIYLSSSAFNFVSMTSYSTFCFLQYIRISAFYGDRGSLRDGLAETFWFYSQNLPTISLLLPRAGLALALLFGFSTPNASAQLELVDANIQNRDGTFFQPNGCLTSYARGILIANAAWTVWRALVLLTSWVGLWIVSGQGCAGLCGPRFRWEEEDGEKRLSVHSEVGSDIDIIPWSWRECTQTRIQDIFAFCLTVRPSLRLNVMNQNSDAEKRGSDLEQVLAAVGFPSAPQPAKRGVLTEDLFQNPNGGAIPSPDMVIQIAKRPSSDKLEGPSSHRQPFPYPFTANGAQASSKDKVPFPPSPGRRSKGTSKTSDRSESGTTSSSSSNSTDDDEESSDDDDDESNDVLSEPPSTGQASGSMSSLGHPISSRYPFQFRRPGRGHSRGNSYSSGVVSRMSPSTNTHSTQSRVSQATQSTGNPESSDSPRSLITSGSDAVSRSGLPLPPRHPQQAQGRGRQRAGSIQVPILSPPTIVFPSAEPRVQRHSDVQVRISSPDADFIDGQEDADEPDQASVSSSHSNASHDGEQDDVVGLLSPQSPSPKSSLFHRASNLSQRSRASSRHNSYASASSRSRTSSVQASIRSRAESLMQNIGAASQSSLELVQTVFIRSRSNSSMARLEDGLAYSPSSDGSQSRSASGTGSAQSLNENNTFGVPVRRVWAPAPPQEAVEEEEPVNVSPSPEQQLDTSFEEQRSDGSSSAAIPSPLNTSSEDVGSYNEGQNAFVHDLLPATTPSSPMNIPRQCRREGGYDSSLLDTDVIGGPASLSIMGSSSRACISTAAPSFVTGPTTVTEGTESSGMSLSSWGDLSRLIDRADGTWRPPAPV